MPSAHSGRAGVAARRTIAAFVVAAWLAPAASLLAQQSADLDTTRVRVTRDAPRSPLEIPLPLTQLTPDVSRPALRRSGIGDLLLGAPGVQVQARNNPTQDPRIAVRGFGARSAFGVRGVRVLRDGVPLTLPDGQTPLDWLDLETAGDVEILRGTASALYGNASGGVIDVHTREAAPQPFAPVIRSWRGGAATRVATRVSGTIDRRDDAEPWTYLGGVSRTETDGPRTYARQRTTSGFARVAGTIGETRLALDVSGFDMPLADNPGALTADELATDVRLADPQSVARGARKAVQHGQLSVRAARGDGPYTSEMAAWVGGRSLDNPLPFAVVDVGRRNWGAWVRGARGGRVGAFESTVSAGLDIQGVRDIRRNFANCVGQAMSASCPVANTERGTLRLEQREQVQSEGGFVRWELAVPRVLTASVAVRQDQIRFSLDDRFVGDGDASGDRALTATTPMLGVTWRLRPTIALFASASTAFETPTVTELTNRADGGLGLNDDLAPQRTRAVDAGVRGLVGTSTWIDLTAFASWSRDELVPFDVPGQVGRRAFRNAGRTSRRGVELSARHVRTWGEAGVAASVGRYRLDEYAVDDEVFDGNPIPGVPAQQWQGWLTVRRGGWFATIDAQAQSSVTVDDGATARADAWQTVGVRLGGDGGWHGLSPIVGVENLFDARFASAVLVNATRGRFYEPSAPRTWFAGINWAP